MIGLTAAWSLRTHGGSARFETPLSQITSPLTASAESSMLSQELFTIEYTEDEWAEESYALGAERADPVPCPRCKRTGFYGPRALEAKYRACRFCGFFQEVGHGPLRFVPVVHACNSWPECAKAAYVWWVPPEQKKYTLASRSPRVRRSWLPPTIPPTLGGGYPSTSPTTTTTSSGRIGRTPKDGW